MKGHGNFRDAQLTNFFAIRDIAVIREAETIFTTLAAAEGMPNGSFDVDHFKAVHQKLLGDMYPWAGSFREGQLTIGDGYAKTTTPPNLLDMEVGRVLKQLKKASEEPITRAEFADRLATAYVKLYELSPFPDGNARASRAILDKFAEVNEMEVSWHKVPAEAFHAAVTNAMSGGDKAAINTLFRHMTDHVDLFNKVSTNAVTEKMVEIAKSAGLTQDQMPSSLVLANAPEHISRFAHYAKQVTAKRLEQYGAGGLSSEERSLIEKTSIQHEMANTVGSHASNVTVLNETLDKIGNEKPAKAFSPFGLR